MKFAIVIVAAVLAYADAYGSGAPESACQDMIPKHPVAPQKTYPPYTITTSTKVAKAGVPMEVVITGKDASNTIGGILLQARQKDTPVGTFTVAPNDPFSKLLSCGAPGNAVTHKKHDKAAEKQKLVYTWTPPKGFNDEIKFRATVAYNGATFWVGVESAPVKVTA